MVVNDRFSCKLNTCISGYSMGLSETRRFNCAVLDFCDLWRPRTKTSIFNVSLSSAVFLYDMSRYNPVYTGCQDPI